MLTQKDVHDMPNIICARHNRKCCIQLIIDIWNRFEMYNFQSKNHFIESDPWNLTTNGCSHLPYQVLMNKFMMLMNTQIGGLSCSRSRCSTLNEAEYLAYDRSKFTYCRYSIINVTYLLRSRIQSNRSWIWTPSNWNWFGVSI